jgi:Protein of unknown function (DUF3054)
MTGSVSSPDPPARVAERFGSRGPGGWILPPGRVALLIAGDVVSFLLFAILGLWQHNQGTASGIVASVRLVIAIAFPFAAGWFLVSPFLHAYKRSHTLGVGPMLRQTEIAWLCSWPVALVLRWIFSTDHQVPLAFALVILVANGVLLGVWRGIFALVEEMRSRSAG